MATQDLGELGTGASDPVVLEWRWYYHIPGLRLWPLLAVLLMLRENRRLQVWSIVVPLATVILTVEGLRAFPDGDTQGAEMASIFFITLAAAWAALWLLGERLPTGRVATTSALAAGLILLMGFATRAWTGRLLPAVAGCPVEMLYCVVGIALPTALAIAGQCCGRVYRPVALSVWLFVWLPVTSVVTAIVVLLPWVLWAWMHGPSVRILDLGQAILLAIAVGLVGLVLAGAIYLFQLPFMALALACPVYRERLKRFLRVDTHPPLANRAQRQSHVASA